MHLIYLVSWFIVLICLVLATAFSTLLERKILSLTQNRIGPNKTTAFGLLQPVLDGMKLFMKTALNLETNHKLLYKLVPFFSFFMCFLLFLVLPIKAFNNNMYQIFWILIIFGLNSHLLLLAGWTSQNKFSGIGSIRNLSQTISFEILLSLLIFLPYLQNSSLNWDHYFTFSICFLFWIWLTVFLMENQRAPFDLSEAESELVSGFNTEYAALFFTYFFLAEYSNLLITAGFTNLILVDWSHFVICWIFLWFILRSCFPRCKFNEIMSFSWMIILPNVLFQWLCFISSSWI